MQKLETWLKLNQSALQAWCREVIQDRFDKLVAVAHHRPINKVKPLREVTALTRRQELARRWGFRFNAFAKVLNLMDFWPRTGQDAVADFLGPEVDFKAVVNILNGASDIDYENLYLEAQRIFCGLKIHRFSQKNPPEHECPSSLSVPDILLGAVIERLNRHLPVAVRERAQELSLLNLDESVSNSRRIQLSRERDRMYQEYPVSGEFQELSSTLEQALEELRLPAGHPGSLVSMEQLKRDWGGVDVIAPIAHYDFRLGWEARCLLVVFPDAFICPSGFQQPHDVKELGVVVPRHTEAEEIVAACLCDQYPDNFWNLPGMRCPLSECPPAQLWDIIFPGGEAIDTVGNAATVASHLPALVETLGRPARVIIITTPVHAARALVEFQSRISPEYAERIGVWEVASPVMQKIGSRCDPHGILDIFCEYIKRLYMLASS